MKSFEQDQSSEDLAAVTISDEVRKLGLEKYVLELEVDGLTVLPAEVNGFALDRIDHAVEFILTRATELTNGCRFTLDDGPIDELEFDDDYLTPEVKAIMGLPEEYKQSQFLLQGLSQADRVWRDMAINPAAVALINHLTAGQGRFSSFNTFVKWLGQGYGPGLGLHADQGRYVNPLGSVSLVANATWCLTDYSESGGALAYVPGSHKFSGMPNADAPAMARPVVAAKGSVIVWHGALWHGAYPRLDPGMRLGYSAYYRHVATLPQENVKDNTTEAMINDTDDPTAYRTLSGVDDTFPYGNGQSEKIPTLKKVAASA